MTSLILSVVPQLASAQQDSVILNGFNRFYYPSGTLSSEGSLVNGKPDGIWKAYYENGTLKSIGNRKDAKPDSTWKFFSDSGVLTAEYTYSDGIKDGLQREFHTNGKPKSEEMLAGNKRHGLCRYFNEEGVMEKEIRFEDGRENGPFREFAGDGRIITEGYYEKGYLKKIERINRTDKFGFRQGIWRTYYENGQTETESRYVDDRLHGLYKEFAPDGTIRKTKVYDHGREVVDKVTAADLKIKRYYHNNGRPKSSVNTINGLRQGIYREYDREGIITAGKLYRDDKVIAEGISDGGALQQGHWKYFFEDGALRSEGDYLDGKREGEWVFYYHDGRVQQRGSYRKDKPVGEWKWMYHSGNILREENYVNGREDGYSREYNDSSEVIAEGNYIEGNRDGTWKFSNNEYVAEGQYLDGRKEGEWVQVYRNGKTAFKGSYRDGFENGRHTYYYDNGNTKEERNYKLGLRDGEWKTYDYAGELVLRTTYSADKEEKIEGVRIGPPESGRQ